MASIETDFNTYSTKNKNCEIFKQRIDQDEVAHI